MNISKKDKIYIAGHRGLVGSAILRVLKKKNYSNLIFKTRDELDLRDQKKTFYFLKKTKPKFIFVAAAKVGGINSNNIYKADFIYQNLIIQNNIIHGAYLAGVRNIIFLGSSCVYPRNCKQPIKEEYLLNGYLEKTNEPYAIAKLAGIKLCEFYNFQYKTNYKTIMPCNTYGPGDNYNLKTSHFLPALIKKIYLIKKNKKKKLILWGSGNVKREFIHVDDLAEACVSLMNKKIREDWINVGSNKDYKIKEVAKIALKVLKIKAKIVFDKSMPDGTPRKKLDIKKIKKYQWKPKINLRDGIFKTFNDFEKKID